MSPSSSLVPALAAVVLWLAAGLGAGYWALLAWGRSPVTPVQAVAEAPVVSDTASVARALGAVPQAPTADAAAPAAPPSSYALLGVIDQSGPGGAALIAFNGQAPKPYRVGAEIEGGLFLLSVDRIGARLGASRAGPPTVELSLPLPATN